MRRSSTHWLALIVPPDACLAPMPPAERRSLHGITEPHRLRQASWARHACRLLLAGAEPDRVVDVASTSHLSTGEAWIHRAAPTRVQGASTAIRVSLAHQGALCLAAISDGAVGCDVTARVPDDDTFVRANFTDQERSWLDRAADHRHRAARVARLWSIKEAWFKATDSRHNFDPGRLDVQFATADSASGRGFARINGRRAVVRLHVHDEHLITVLEPANHD